MKHMQNEPAQAMLKVEHLSKIYHGKNGDNFEAVRDVSFEIPEGVCFGLLGPNGAGKSTTIQCISGFYPPAAGRVLINGLDVHREPKKARKFLGICSQDENLDGDFKVYDQLVWHARYFHIPMKTAKPLAEDLLKRFVLSDKADARVEALSGGMKRRLQVARAFISNPKLLVLDEPTTGLDPDVRRILWEVLIESKKQGMAILLCTHYMEEAARLCDQVAIMSKGQILDIDSPEGLVKKYIAREVVEEEVRPGVIWKRPPNLEDVYLKLTGSHLGVADL
jgi:lipooligosaccharide transport system ATP-binding protein